MPLIRNTVGGGDQRRGKNLPPLRGARTSAGVTVTPEKALQISAVYSCVRLLAETGSMLPVSLLRRTADGRERVRDHPLYRLVAEDANPNLDAAEYWRLMLGWMLLRGNAYAYVQRNRAGDPVGLWPVAPTSVEPRRGTDGGLVYAVTLDADEYAPITERNGLVRGENMQHYRAFGLDGVEGLSPIGLARQSAGISFAAQSYIGGFFERDASPGSTISVPGELSDKAYERLTTLWQDLHEGFDRSHRLALLEGGAKWEHTSLSPADAQFLETYRLTRADIAGIYGVPPHMIGDVDKATSWGTGIEQQSLGYVIYSLMPWLTRLERVVSRLRGPDRTLYVKINPAGLQRGDITARYTAYAQARQWGWFSANDIRELEDLDPIEDGDTYLHPVNMVPAGDAAPPAQRAGTRPPETRALQPGHRQYPAWVQRHTEALAEYFTAQRDAVLAAYATQRTRDAAAAVEEVTAADAVSELAQLLLSLGLDLAAEVGAATARALGGVFTLSWLRPLLEANAEASARSINTTTARQIQQALATAEDLGDPSEVLVELFSLMLEQRTPALAAGRVDEVTNMAGHDAARQSGATHKTWRTTGAHDRPSHAAADGQTVPIDGVFTVGSHQGRWPRDHTLGVDEIAGCDCVLEFSTQEET